MTGQLHRNVADTAGRAGNEHALSHERSAFPQRMQSRKAGHGQGGSLLERHLVGQGCHRGDRYGDAPGRGRSGQADDPGAGGGTRPIVGRGHDDTRKVATYAVASR
jgi:hypothetical protein